MDLAKQVEADIKTFNKINNIQSNIMIWCGSTEIFLEPSEVHSSLSKFEDGLLNNDPKISPSMIYAYSALKNGYPFC